ncbi:MAG: transcriptional repressor LexA [bacterium]|nr:transcriptional repressor LexA [bacterium]
MLTKRQTEIFNYIKVFIEHHDYAPSYREIAKKFDLASIATVAEHIESLKDKGYLRGDISGARSLQLSPQWDNETFNIPLMGSIAAGSPIEAIRTKESIDIPRDMMGPNIFALKVRGESMIDDGILDGDYVIIESTNHPRNGDIIVALLDNDNVTLKRYYKEKDHIRLQPANSNFKPIRVKKIIVQGKVRGVIRKFR